MSKKSKQKRGANQFSPNMISSIPTAVSATNESGQSRTDSDLPSILSSTSGSRTVAEPSQNRLPAKLKRNWLVVAIIALVSLGTLGAGLKYLDDDARREMAKRNASTPLNPVKDESLLNSVNPFLPAPLPSPTPQLSKEYIYAGSRLLAVEDVNASVASPADLAVWRPSNGTWYVMGAGGTVQAAQSWGASGDFPAAGDYDGDGKTDFSVFRPNNNTWYIFNSSSATISAIPFGQQYDQRAQADYDGDGRTDPAVFRDTGMNSGTWFIQGSAAGFYQIPFGLASDAPAPADYDGDGRADVAVWRNSGTTFYSQNSSNNLLQTASIGQASSEPVSADYDGDGRADYAVRSGANWIIKSSANGQLQSPISWEQAGDKAVHNDYDGDGKVDIAVWREANGNWYIRKSSNNQLRQETWGTAGDIPVPAFYRR